MRTGSTARQAGLEFKAARQARNENLLACAKRLGVRMAEIVTYEAGLPVSHDVLRRIQADASTGQ